MLSRKISAAAVAAILSGVTAVGTAVPASAASTTTNFANCQAALDGQSISVPSGNDLRITFTTCSIPTYDLKVGTSQPATGTSITVGAATVDLGPGYVIDVWDGISGGAPDGSYQVFYRTTTPSTYQGSFTVVVGGSSPSPSPSPSGTSSSSPAPQAVTIDLGLEGSELPASWSSTATLGTWKQIPDSASVTGVGEDAGKTFLGVATTPDFPVAIAQRQIDNGWGTYEIFNEDGSLQSVFIPAGSSLFLSASTRLYPIWSE